MDVVTREEIENVKGRGDLDFIHVIVDDLVARSGTWPYCLIILA